MCRSVGCFELQLTLVFINCAVFHSSGLFGEGPADRRERLRILILDLGGFVSLTLLHLQGFI